MLHMRIWSDLCQIVLKQKFREVLNNKTVNKLCKRGLKYVIIPCRVIHSSLKLLASYKIQLTSLSFSFFFDYGHALFKYIYNNKNFK